LHEGSRRGIHRAVGVLVFAGELPEAVEFAENLIDDGARAIVTREEGGVALAIMQENKTSCVPFSSQQRISEVFVGNAIH